ncbi:Ig-like domain-containing protein [Actinoplanes sp. NPDC048796]|uniref:Ig-like domain-containing protein n=1 Tax=Actinoplanes sp. NPDC048796 TaxID=3155640 RepID=UPI00340AB478
MAGIVVPGAPAVAATVGRVNFQPAGSAAPAGYVADTGAGFDAGRGYGWVRRGTAEALDLARNTRDRGRAGVDSRLDTIVHMQYGDVGGANGVLTEGAWEYAVADGTYQVTVSVGDQAPYDSRHTVRVEGVPAVDGFVSTAGAEFRAATVAVAVTDGRLTVDAVGGVNTKLNYVDIARDFSLKVDFSDAATAPAAGYVRDSGGAFTTARGYGWVRIGTRTPVDLTGNGRNRNPAAGQADPRLATFMHAQLSGGTGSWEAAVPAGLYAVTVAVGDAGTAVDSTHWVSIEDQNAIAAFVPTATTKFATVTRTVRVTDGALTISPAGGVNTKFAYADIAAVAAAETIPAVRAGTPANGTTNVPVTASVVEDLVLPNGGVRAASLTASTVTLTRLTDGAAVAATVITSGGGDVINLSPTAPLAPSTAYRFTVTSGVTDVTGKPFAPYSIVFTTGTGGPTGGPAAFDKTVGVATGAPFTTVVKGPDGRLYAGTLDGRVFRFPITTGGTLGSPTVINTVRDNAGTTRTVIGMAFDPASTAAAPILWVTDNDEYVGPLNVPDWSGRIGRLSGADLTTYTPMVVNLPRSVKDHETNSLAFGPDGALYVSQGANNAMGAADSTWGNRPERLLSAAVLRLDPAKLTGTLNVKTEEGGTYDPYAANAPLTIYATGVRNAYDLVWHRNGHLYAPTNGSAAGGNTPATPATLPASCARRGYTGPAVPALSNVPTAETDYVFDVLPGRYYGHPNPVRCEWVLAGGNPTSGTDPFQVGAYPVGTRPDPNLHLAGITDAGLHASANGAIEYRGGVLDGKLLVVRYSSGQDIETFDVSPAGALSNRTTGITGFTGFSQPLDLTQDPTTGFLYVTELGASRITLLKARS